MKIKRWKILDRGSVPVLAETVSYTCPACLRDAELPVLGTVIAQLGPGLIFDPGPRALPSSVRCPSCHHSFELEVPA